MKALVISSPVFAEIRGQTAAILLKKKKKKKTSADAPLTASHHIYVCAIHQGSMTGENKLG